MWAQLGNRNHPTLKVVPYEHRGAVIRRSRIDSEEDFLRLHDQFVAERDKWLRKLIALTLLEGIKHGPPNIDTNPIQEAIQCRVQ